VLVVDDEESILRMLTDMLEILGLEPVAVSGVDEARQELARAPFDLVISDIVMPGPSGLELLHELRSTRPELPVVLIAAFENLKSSVDLGDEKPAGFLAKPFHFTQVEELLTQVLGPLQDDEE